MLNRAPADIEGFFNLLSSHILALHSADSTEYAAGISKIADIVSRSPHEQASVKYRVYVHRSYEGRIISYSLLLALRIYLMPSRERHLHV